VQKGVNKDVHLVVDFLESGEFHGHALLKKGVNPLVSQRPDDVCSRTSCKSGWISCVGLSITCMALNWEIMPEWPFL
jgi:hypothetical protein